MMHEDLQAVRSLIYQADNQPNFSFLLLQGGFREISGEAWGWRASQAAAVAVGKKMEMRNGELQSILLQMGSPPGLQIQVRQMVISPETSNLTNPSH